MFVVMVGAGGQVMHIHFVHCMQYVALEFFKIIIHYVHNLIPTSFNPPPLP